MCDVLNKEAPQSVADYNYPVFPEDMEGPVFEQYPRLIKVGDSAPDAELTRLGDRVRLKLSEYWHRKYLVIEFGSFT